MRLVVLGAVHEELDLVREVVEAGDRAQQVLDRGDAHAARAHCRRICCAPSPALMTSRTPSCTTYFVQLHLYPKPQNPKTPKPHIFMLI